MKAYPMSAVLHADTPITRTTTATTDAPVRTSTIPTTATPTATTTTTTPTVEMVRLRDQNPISPIETLRPV